MAPGLLTVATWKDGHKGALSVSVDDGEPSCFDQLRTHGFAGTYLMSGQAAPSFFSAYYNAGMELGSHLVDHVCTARSDEILRQDIESNIQGICSTIPGACTGVISLAWPCGYTNANEEAVAADYFLSARGYNANQLEDPTPADFYNLKSFNSHEHAPYPPEDLKTVVSMAEQQGKWANLVFHTTCNDDGAIAFAATKDVWVAPVGTVTKYILQRDRALFKDYVQGADSITFSFARRDLPASKTRSFDTAINADDTISLLVKVDSSRQVASVRVNGTAASPKAKWIGGKMFLLINTAVDTNYRAVEIKYNSLSPAPTPTPTPAPTPTPTPTPTPEPAPAIVLSPAYLSFHAVKGTNPASKSVALTNGGGGTLTWTATADSAAPEWLSVSPGSGTGDMKLTISVASAELPPGTYTKVITVAAPGAANTPQTVNVSLRIDKKK